MSSPISSCGDPAPPSWVITNRLGMSSSTQRKTLTIVTESVDLVDGADSGAGAGDTDVNDGPRRTG